MANSMGFNIFDVVIVVLIVLLSLKGLFSGFKREFLSSLGLIGGIFTASYFHKTVANYIFSNITDTISIKVLNLISLITIFILFYIFIKLLSKAISIISSNNKISATSRLSGMVVKLATLFFILSLVTYAISTKKSISKKIKDTTNTSKLYPLLKNTGAYILNMHVASNTSNAKQKHTATNANLNVNIETNSTTTNKKDSNTTTKINNKITNISVKTDNKNSETNSRSDTALPTTTYNTETNNTNIETNSTQN